jgi:3-hydroxyacyl-CoA dehydrogenase
MSNYINKAVVMGAGVMGASIAGLLASVGVETVMLDIVPPNGLTEEEKAAGLTENSPEFRNRFSKAGYDRVKNPRNNMLYSKGKLKNLRYGNTTDNLFEITGADWVIEAVSEKVAVKQSVLKQIAPYLNHDTIISSNTSGVNVHSIVEGLNSEIKRCFMGTHFFNPPRWMALFEMIATEWTDKTLYASMQRFAEDTLGKAVVHAKDTPNFVGNRIGTFGGVTSLKLAEKYGYDFPTLDLLTGPIAGHPKSATCKTNDMVGLDVFLDVAGNVLSATTDEREKVDYEPPQFVKDMVADGHWGDKVKHGFYKKEVIDGKRVTLCYDPKTKTYIQKKADEIPSIAAAKASGNKYEYMNYGDTKEQKFTNDLNKATMLYAARLVPEIADDFKEIDKALTAGFNWDHGIFQMWDKIGVRRSVEQWQSQGEEIPQWVLEMLASGQENFYAGYVEEQKYIRLKGCNIVKGNDDASIKDLGDRVLCVEFHSMANAISDGVGEMLMEASYMLKSDDWVGLVIGNEGKNFCAGADLFTILGMAQDKKWSQLDKQIQALQAITKTLKFAARPTVSAPFQQTLGGGCEIAMHCAASVPHTDTFMGLVEVGVGLIPAGGGCSELLVRMMNRCYNDQKKSRYDAIVDCWQYIMSGKVNTGADAAIEAGYLSRDTHVERNKAKQIQSAKETVIWMANHGYRPGCDGTIKVAGDYGYGAIAYNLAMMKNGNFASDYDIHIGEKIAHVITGGDLPYGAEVAIDQIRDLEREAFLSLAGEEKTQERIVGMLTNGRAVRN